MAKTTDKDKGDKQSLTFKLTRKKWIMIAGQLCLQLFFQIFKGNNKITGEIKGQVFGNDFSADVTQSGETSVAIPGIALDADIGKLEAVFTSDSGETSVVSADINVETPSNAYSVEIFPSECEFEGLLNLVIGVRAIYKNGQPDRGLIVEVKALGKTEKVILNQKGEGQCIFWPVEYGKVYQVEISTPDMGATTCAVRVGEKVYRKTSFEIDWQPESEMDADNRPTKFGLVVSTWDDENHTNQEGLAVKVQDGTVFFEEKTDSFGVAVFKGLPFNLSDDTKVVVLVPGGARYETTIERPQAVGVQPAKPNKSWLACVKEQRANQSRS